MNKKLLIVIVVGALLIFGGLSVVMYLFLFADDPKESFRDILPFGQRGDVELDERDREDETDEGGEVVETYSFLRKLSDHPVVEGGYVVFENDNDLYIRYLSRGDGLAYQVKSTGDDHVKIVKEEQSLAGLYQASWFDENTAITYIAVDDHNNRDVLLTEIRDGGETFSVNSVGLDRETVSLAFAPERRSVFYTVRDGTGVNGFTHSFNGVESVSGAHVFSSPIREWDVEWTSNNTVTLTTTPSGFVPGHMYTLNLQNNSLTHRLRGLKGLTTRTNPNASMTLYNKNESGDFSLWLYDHNENTSTIVSNLKTLVEKCLWKDVNSFICAVPKKMPGGVYPDDWYKGKVSFSDDYFVEIDVELSGVREVILKTDTVGDGQFNVDGYSLKLSASGQELFFIDRKTGDLWVYEIESKASEFDEYGSQGETGGIDQS